MSALVGEAQAQWMVALDHANAARFAVRDVKREVRAGVLSVADALDDPRAASIPVLVLLMAQPWWGRERAKRVLAPSFIDGQRRVRELTDRQRRVIREGCSR